MLAEGGEDYPIGEQRMGGRSNWQIETVKKNYK